MPKKGKAIKPKKQYKKISLVTAGALLLMSAIVIGLVVSSLIKDMNVKSAMTQYLKSKYNEDFVVKKPKYKNGGFGVQGIWSAQAHPVNNIQLEFSVDCSPRSLSDCSDTYLDSFFSKQEYDRLKLTMKNMGVTDYSVRLIISYEALDSITKSTGLTHVKQRHDPIYKLKVSVDKANIKNNIAGGIAAIVNEAYADGISRVEVEYEVATIDGKNYKCTTDYESTPRLTSEIIDRCLKEV